MTRMETLAVLTLLEVEYPHSFRSLSEAQKAAKVELWAAEFAQEDAQSVMAAVRLIMSTEPREFAPNIGHVRQKLYEARHPEEQTEMEAWAMVSRALRNGVYGAKEEFEKLPPDIQATVGSPNQLKEWALMDPETVQSVVSSNFQRSYKVRRARSRADEQINPDVRKLLQSVSAKMLPDGGKEMTGNGSGTKKQIPRQQNPGRRGNL